MTQRGKYTLITRLASGGMAEVYAARRGDGRGELVVIKQMLPQFVGSAAFAEMFLDEGRTIALLDHPSIVRMLDFGYQDELPYLAMEYVHGMDLRALLRASRQQRTEIPAAVALQIVLRMLAGLHFAHEARTLDGFPLELVHRDISPQNVIVTFEGEVKLIDFGIAKARGRSHETRSGVLKGKVPYMAPEQVRNGPMDRRVDVYATGVILFELLTGRRPYQLERQDREQEPQGEFALMMAIVDHRTIPLTDLRPDLPLVLERVIERALAATVAARFATAAAFAEALGEAVREVPALEPREGQLARLMSTLFADSDRRWRAALLDHADEPKTLLALLQTRHGVSDDAGTEIDAPPTVAAIDVARPLTEVSVLALPRVIDGSFQGPDLGNALTGSVVIEAGTVERILASGVPRWLGLMRAAEVRQAELQLFLVHCPPVLVAQARQMRAFLDPAHVVSVTAEFGCTACGFPFAVTLDCEHDAAAFVHEPAPRPCPRCAAPARLDHEPTHLAPLRVHAGRPLPPHVRAALAPAKGGNLAASAIEKQVTSDRTLVRVTRSLDRGARWARILVGVEGMLELDVSAAWLDREAAAALAAALAKLSPEVIRIVISGAPEAVADAFAAVPRCELRGSLRLGRCERCGMPRAVADPGAPCRRCGGPLAFDTRAPLARGGSAPVPAQRRRLRLIVAVAIVVGLLTGVAISALAAAPTRATDRAERAP